MKILKRILLVEDNIQDSELTLAALSESHVANDIVVARDGVEALDYLHARGRFAGREPGLPAVMLLDIKMPRMDGLEVLRHMKQDASFRTIPVVMLTSSREEPDLAQSYSLGVNAYVVKPVDFQQFFDAVKQVGAFWGILNQPPPAAGQAPAEPAR
jgi:CheY-like chemotaxis protein